MGPGIQVAYLPQLVFLIDHSLRCNVALGEKEADIDETRLKKAIRQARLSELIEQLPEGLNAIIEGYKAFRDNGRG